MFANKMFQRPNIQILYDLWKSVIILTFVEVLKGNEFRL